MISGTSPFFVGRGRNGAARGKKLDFPVNILISINGKDKSFFVPRASNPNGLQSNIFETMRIIY